jgi:hypothetical protein
MLLRCRPFSGWTTLPHPDEVRFVVEADPHAMGTYFHDEGEKWEHIVTISKEKCGHLDTVIKTLAHEMIHMRRHKTTKWDQHDAIFRRYAKQIADELGFDPLEL